MPPKSKNNLYFDLQNGISGDMAVAALLSLGGDGEQLKEKLNKLNLKGYDITIREEQRNGFYGHSFIVHTDKNHNKSRNYQDIKKIIQDSYLTKREKLLTLTIFNNIAEAEAHVHHTDLEHVHFHEIGALDSIIDIVGFSILYSQLAIQNTSASTIHLGKGQTQSMHGTIPIPSPATLEITKGLPVKGVDIDYELTTPTGASMVKSVVTHFGPLPFGTIKKIGIGFGKRKAHGFNALRVLQYADLPKAPEIGGDSVKVIDVTIDDSTPEEIGFLQERIFSEGALEVYVTPIFMKKNRPAFNITVICRPEDFSKCSLALIEESSTFGLRFHSCNRIILKRKMQKIDTQYGKIAVKIGYIDQVPVKVSPEYEDLRRAAKKHKVTLRTVSVEVMKTLMETGPVIFSERGTPRQEG